jgi:hypothetical protein
VWVLGRLPGDLGHALGSINPLTAVLGALVVALATEFGIVLIERFHEGAAADMTPDDAATSALDGAGRAVGVSALTLGAGFAVLALSAFVPGNLPLVSGFGLAVLMDLTLAVAATLLVMMPLAVALARREDGRPQVAHAAPAAAPAAPAIDAPPAWKPAAGKEPSAPATKRPRSPRTKAPRADKPAGGDDVLTQIERLSELHDRGILSDEEFASKKRELLDRM